MKRRSPRNFAFVFERVVRAMVKRLLRKYGYPPDKQEAATKLVLEQAELLCSDLAA